jgi:hypothetical protein
MGPHLPRGREVHHDLHGHVRRYLRMCRTIPKAFVVGGRAGQ